MKRKFCGYCCKEIDPKQIHIADLGKVFCSQVHRDLYAEYPYIDAAREPLAPGIPIDLDGEEETHW